MRRMYGLFTYMISVKNGHIQMLHVGKYSRPMEHLGYKPLITNFYNLITESESIRSVLLMGGYGIYSKNCLEILM